jgi:hypothetical protein
MVGALIGESLGGQRYSPPFSTFRTYGNVPGITEGTWNSPAIEVV